MKHIALLMLAKISRKNIARRIKKKVGHQAFSTQQSVPGSCFDEGCNARTLAPWCPADLYT